MKPTVVDEDFEDAEEENKLINEVRRGTGCMPKAHMGSGLSAGVQDMVSIVEPIKSTGMT